MNLKGFINNPVVYFPKLTNWINDKIAFWQTDLGSNLLQNNSRNVNVRRSLAVSTSEQRPNVGRIENIFFSCRSNSSLYNRPISEIKECPFCRDKSHVSLFDCECFRVVHQLTHFWFVLNNGLC